MIRISQSVSVIQRGKSGVATYVFGLLEGFRRLGWPAEFTIIGLEEDRPLFEPWIGPCRWIPVPERWRPAAANVLWHQTALKGILKKTSAEVLHIPSYRRIVHRPPCPQVVTIHDCAPFRFPGKYDALRMAYGRHVVVPLARRVDQILSVSKSTADDIETFFGIPASSVTITYNGIDHERFSPESASKRLEALKRPAGLEPGWWIYVARLEHPAKNHIRLIEAFSGLCRKHGDRAGQLVLAGADWHGSEAIHEAARKSEARDRIFITGFVSSEDLPGWYGGARALVFPSLFEGFGIPPLEAMACGAPVLCPDQGALGEVAGSAALAFNPLDSLSIQQAMERLIVEPGLRGRLVEQGFQRSAGFRWENAARETLAAYGRAAGKLASPGRPTMGGS